MDQPELTVEEFERELKKIRLWRIIKERVAPLTNEEWLSLAADYDRIGARANAYYCKRHAGVFEPVYSPFTK